MAVRFDATGENYTRTMSLGSTTNLSVACWFKISTDRNTFSTVWAIDSATTNYIMLSSDMDGTTMSIVDGGNILNSTALVASTWYFFGISVVGGTGTRTFRSASSSAFTTSTWTGGVTSVTATTLRIGADIFSGEWLNGCVAAFKLWTGAALTAAELQQEANSYTPSRTANLRAWYPLTRAETTDYSGMGQTLSGGTGATTEDGPPLAWGARHPARRRPVTAPPTVGFQGWGVPL